MDPVHDGKSGETAPVCLLLSPLAVLLAVAAATGIGFDVFAVTGELPVTVAICTPIAFLLARSLPRAARRLSGPLSRAGQAYAAAFDPGATPAPGPNYAP